MQRYAIAVLVLLGAAAGARAQEKPPVEKPAETKPAETKPAESKPAKPLDKEALYKQFEKSLTGAKLVGRFTMFGREDKEPIKEEYTLTSVTKLPEGDYWLFKSRIKYGGTDVTVPLPLEVKWAGDTPVITLTDFTIPGMGTFSARVVVYRDTYAGWWEHGKAGGHLFGKVEKIVEEKKSEVKEEKKTP